MIFSGKILLILQIVHVANLKTHFISFSIVQCIISFAQNFSYQYQRFVNRLLKYFCMGQVIWIELTIILFATQSILLSNCRNGSNFLTLASPWHPLYLFFSLPLSLFLTSLYFPLTHVTFCSPYSIMFDVTFCSLSYCCCYWCCHSFST